MESIAVGSFADLMAKGSCVIVNPIKGDVVRTLTVDGDNCVCLAGDVELIIPLQTPITYQAWHFDRGNLLFKHEHSEDELKICTEADILQLPSGEQFRIVPSEEIFNAGADKLSDFLL